MEVTLVHPDARETKVVVTHPVQEAAYRGQGFVSESELEVMAVAPSAPAEGQDVEELARLKAENKALKSENTKLKNKLEKTEGDESKDEEETK